VGGESLHAPLSNVPGPFHLLYSFLRIRAVPSHDPSNKFQYIEAWAYFWLRQEDLITTEKKCASGNTQPYILPDQPVLQLLISYFV
jgi:hypothetical protein